jgi:prepilin-type N-terminal cleavage/methylation domain-containing protein
MQAHRKPVTRRPGGFLLSTQCPGFTLVELLVVIAVLAVLMAVLLPVLGRAREYGRRVACLGHLRQMQMGWQMYADEHDDDIVNGTAWGWALGSSVPTPGTPWMCGGTIGLSYAYAPVQTQKQADEMMKTGALASYVGDVRTYLCPSRYRNVIWFDNTPGYFSSYYIVGSMNCIPVEVWQNAKQYKAIKSTLGRTVMFVRRTAELGDPPAASRMVFMDHGWGPALYGGWGWSGFPFDIGGRLGPMSLPIHHADGTCMSFADGHAEYWKWKDPVTIAFTKDWLSQMWGTGVLITDADMPAPPEEFRRVWKAVWAADWAFGAP